MYTQVKVAIELADIGVNVDIYDHGFEQLFTGEKQDARTSPTDVYDGVIVAVAHDVFKNLGHELVKKSCKKSHVIYDLKNLWNVGLSDIRL